MRGWELILFPQLRGEGAGGGGGMRFVCLFD